MFHFGIICYLLVSLYEIHNIINSLYFYFTVQVFLLFHFETPRTLLFLKNVLNQWLL
jgi:hypothetical protein